MILGFEDLGTCDLETWKFGESREFKCLENLGDLHA